MIKTKIPESYITYEPHKSTDLRGRRNKQEQDRYTRMAVRLGAPVVAALTLIGANALIKSNSAPSPDTTPRAEQSLPGSSDVVNIGRAGNGNLVVLSDNLASSETQDNP